MHFFLNQRVREFILSPESTHIHSYSAIIQLLKNMEFICMKNSPEIVLITVCFKYKLLIENNNFTFGNILFM